MDGLIIWAQAGPTTTEGAIAFMGLRRWLAGTTLSSLEALPSRFGLLILLASLGGLLLLVLAVQGPIRALKQVLDVPGHFRLLGAAIGRLKRSARLVGMLFFAAVLSWTTWQFREFNEPRRLVDLSILLKAKSIAEVATEQGVLAALTPQRDVFSLGSVLILLLAASVLVFKLSADRWGSGGGSTRRGGVSPSSTSPLPPWTTIAWGAAWLGVMVRGAGYIMEPEGLPPGGCLFVEALVIPVLMALTDGLLLGWVLWELRRASAEQTDETRGLDTAEVVRLMMRATVVCLLALPARYAATSAWLGLVHKSYFGPLEPFFLDLVRGRAPIVLQGVGLIFVALAGVAAWNRGGLLRGYFRLLRAEGGRVFVAVVVAGLVAGGLSALSYAVLLSLAAQPWVLGAADSYAHYASLPVGLLLLSALVELADRALPLPPPPPSEPDLFDDKLPSPVADDEGQTPADGLDFDVV